MEQVGITSRGYCIYREPNEAGGHRYWSDAIGGGVCIWDTCLASPEELELALRIEYGVPKIIWHTRLYYIGLLSMLVSLAVWVFF